MILALESVIDLIYAITECHGWVKSESDKMVVRLEPLQQASRRKAQEQLCKKLNVLGAQLPTGKTWLYRQSMEMIKQQWLLCLIIFTG
jgi:hypothetical protein